MLTRRGFLSLSGAGLLSATALPAMAREVETLGGRAFGSYWRLTVPIGADTVAIHARIATVIETVDWLFSPYRPESEVSRFNLTTSTDLQPISDACRPVVAAALEIAQASGGAFDPTVGPLVARYGFGPLSGAEQGHFSQLTLTPSGLRKDGAGLSLDLCGIAKGRALDLAAFELDALGVEAYLIDFGGELAERGVHPSGRGWQVAVENPLTGTLAHVLALDGMAVATSALTAQSYAVGGQTIGHIIDPRKGAPVLGQTLSVSVLAPDGMWADGWATGLMALPHEAGIALAEALELDALFLLRDGSGVKTVATGHAAEHLLG